MGSAAGGGLPQWNCHCSNCQAVRIGQIPAQTQSSIAFTTNDQDWWLINASPDLSQQIEKNRELQPRSDSPRNSPIAGVFLTNADIDHVLGLILMRQQESPLIVFASSETREGLPWVEDWLHRFRKIEWQIVDDPELDCLKQFNLPGISVISLKHGAAFHLRDEKSNRAALIAPAVLEMTGELRAAADSSDAIFFDGTFWSDDELVAIRPHARSAREMNHLPINDGSLEFLRKCRAQRKIYTHINNTNPILMPGSAERTRVEQAGIEIGCDGLEVSL